MEAERLNSPHTSAVIFEALGHQLQFSQDPNSKHLGTTVWDASMVLVKFLEKNCRKGRFSPSKLKGKRVIELGAGCGVAGFGMALLGCDVITTDQTEVLPLLMRNVERNTSRIQQLNSDSDSFGSIEVAELNWGDADHIRAVDPPFDYIIGTDVVYAEHLLEPLLRTLISLSGPRTTILLGYELRSTNVHDRMLDLWKTNFEVKTVPKSKMHSEYQHPSIQVYIMNLKASNCVTRGIDNYVEDDKSGEEDVDCSATVNKVDDRKSDRVEEDGKDDKSGEEDDDCSATVKKVDCKSDQVEEDKILENTPDKKLSDWEARRYGAMAARLLRDVKTS